jgi:hypothetical protein
MKALQSLALSVGLAFAAAGAIAANEAAAASVSASNRPDAVIPFEQANRAIFVQVVVAGRPLWFVLDTGDKYAVIDLSVAHALGLELGTPIPVGGAGSATVMGSLVKNGEFSVVGLDGFTQPLFIAIPLDSLAKAEGHAFAGVLGADFIRQFVVDIDYVRHTLTLHDKAEWRYAGRGHALDITFNSSGHPQARAEIVDAAGRVADGMFTLDIGSTGAVILNEPFVEQTHALQPAQASAPLMGGAGVGGDVQGAVGRLSALKLAGFVVAQPITVFTQSKAGAFASADFQGNIGGAVLERFKVTLDYSHSKIFLEPDAHFGSPMDYDMSGLAISAEGPDFKTFEIEEVAPNTPGSRAGLRPGDQVTAIDGRRASDYSLSDLRAKLRRPHTATLAVDRAGVGRRVRLRLQRLI